MKTYNIEITVKEWVLKNKDNIYYDILEACEKNLSAGETPVKVASIRSISGITDLRLTSITNICESLNKCIAFFIETEEYELAARARDCGLSWKNKEYIKKNPNYVG